LRPNTLVVGDEDEDNDNSEDKDKLFHQANSDLHTDLHQGEQEPDDAKCEIKPSSSSIRPNSNQIQDSTCGATSFQNPTEFAVLWSKSTLTLLYMMKSSPRSVCA
jgi:hypothetical protein